MRDGRVVYDGPPLADHGLTARARTTTSTPSTAHDHGHAVRLTQPDRREARREPRASSSPCRSCSGRCSPPLFTGLAAPAVGTYLVQRRLALMGDGIGHVAVTGVALGLLTGDLPHLDRGGRRHPRRRR